MSRIAATFEALKRNDKKGFIPFITAGDPDLGTTEELILELARAGASVIELGVPFSDPMADGPVIQRASERALRHGFGLAAILDVVRAVRKQTTVPIVLFSYFNPLLQFGLEKLAREAEHAEIDGILVTDLIPEEAGRFSAMLRAHDIDLIFLAAPTSTDARLQMIAERASGFVYAVSRAGVTGAREKMSAEAEKLVVRLRGFSDLPVAVGFGISRPEHVQDVWRYADAAVVGSAIVQVIEQHAGEPNMVGKVGQFAGSLVAKI
ncbi:MAG TPA: tryptophan synthase subunit alpha [Pyrinomonadaceae bacterium]|nr:tryptophan synthase subunit alpha [Pyrinomonadaceae bacterium]